MSITPYFTTSAAYQAATTTTASPAIAIVTGAKSGIGLALARKVASFAFIDAVLAVSRSITAADLMAEEEKKLVPVAADVSTAVGRQVIVDRVQALCGNTAAERTKQVRFLIHAAGTIQPIRPVLELQPAELRTAMEVNCEGPLFLTTALYPYLQPLSPSSDGAVAGRVLHVSSGAAHGAPPTGWAAYGISKAAFFQSFCVLEREWRDKGVVCGSFKPGVVDTPMQGVIREVPESKMPAVQRFVNLKEQQQSTGTATMAARPPPSGALDTPENVAHFAEFLLLGTTDAEFANVDAHPGEWDIRHAQHFPRWIRAEHLSSGE